MRERPLAVLPDGLRRAAKKWVRISRVAYIHSMRVPEIRAVDTCLNVNRHIRLHEYNVINKIICVTILELCNEGERGDNSVEAMPPERGADGGVNKG